MKNLIITIAILFSYVGSDIPGSLEKKVDRVLKKSFDESEIVKEKITLPANTEDRPDPGLFLYCLKVDTDTLGFLAVTSAIGRYDYFDYCVIFNTDLSIRKVEVMIYRSDHGYEITSKKWLKQFAGTNGCYLDYGTDIDAIAGATYSASSITSDIGQLCEILKEIE